MTCTGPNPRERNSVTRPVKTEVPDDKAIAAAGSAERYLAGVSHATVVAFGDQAVTEHPGTEVPAAPAALHWAAQAQGAGNLTLTWTVTEGDWVVVVMNQP